jgi:LysR family nitrogen assimilation transcriptional regulator
MELRQLKYFKTIADAHSFARGAQTLRVAQPALSRSIAKLEEEIGQPLFVRHNAGVSLTDAGTRLYAHATKILGDVRELFEGMASCNDSLRGEISFGAPQSIQTMLALPVTAEFLRHNKHCKLNLMQNSSTRLRDHLASGAIDQAIIPLTTDSGFHITPLVRESICLIVPDDARSQFPAVITGEALLSLPLILTGYPYTLSHWLDRIVPNSAELLNIRCEVNNSGMLIDLVLRGVGFGLAPISAMAQQQRGRLGYVPVDGFDVSWAIATNWQRRGMGMIAELERLTISFADELIASGQWPNAERLAH